MFYRNYDKIHMNNTFVMNFPKNVSIILNVEWEKHCMCEQVNRASQIVS